MARCRFVYEDGGRCVYDDHRLREGQMCHAHRVILRHCARQKVKRDRERERRQQRAHT